MDLQTHPTRSGYVLPAVHSFPPFFTQQPNLKSQALIDKHWSKIILGYAQHCHIFNMRVDEALAKGGPWEEVFRNDRINRKVNQSYLTYLISHLASQNRIIYDPPKQTRSAIVCWRLVEEWAEALHSWATSTGQLNTILTFYEIQSPALDSDLTDIPTSLLRRAITILAKTNRAQIIEGAEGGGVRFFAGSGKN